MLSFFSLIKTIYLRVSTEPLPNDAITPLPVDVRRSKTLLLKLRILARTRSRMMTAIRFPAKMTLIHARALFYLGRDTADICRSAPVKLFILTPEKGGF